VGRRLSKWAIGYELAVRDNVVVSGRLDLQTRRMAVQDEEILIHLDRVASSKVCRVPDVALPASSAERQRREKRQRNPSVKYPQIDQLHEDYKHAAMSRAQLPKSVVRVIFFESLINRVKLI